jgi:hypothetical protein
MPRALVGSVLDHSEAGVVNYLHQVMAETLVANGVDSVFGLAGDGNLFLVDT